MQSKKNKADKTLLKTLAAARGEHRETLPRPRSTRFKSKKDYNRQKNRQELRKASMLPR